MTSDGLTTTAVGVADGRVVAWHIEHLSDQASVSLGPAGTRVSAAGSADDLAALAGIRPTATCPNGALAVWALRDEPTLVEGLSDACVADGASGQVVVGVADGGVLVIGPGTDGRPLARWLVDLDAGFEIDAVEVPASMEHVTDVEAAFGTVLAGTSTGRPVVLREQDDEPVAIPGEVLDPVHPLVALATDGVDGVLRVVLQGRAGIRVCTLADQEWACADGPTGLLVDATAMGDDRDTLYLTTRAGDGLELWSGSAPRSP